MTTLDRAEYWQLRSLTLELDRAQTALALAEARIEIARLHRHAYWTGLAARYDLVPDRIYGMRDESCSLFEVETTARG